MHMKEASFHIVITSYQLIIQDIRYFQRIKWHYMILDEAQALKSSSRYASLHFSVITVILLSVLNSCHVMLVVKIR